MHTNAHECVWEKTTPLLGKNYTTPAAEGRDLKRAERFLAMAACIDKNHGEAVAAVEVVREALAIVRRRDDKRDEGVPTFKNFIENDPTHVAMSLGEKEDL